MEEGTFQMCLKQLLLRYHTLNSGCQREENPQETGSELSLLAFTLWHSLLTWTWRLAVCMEEWELNSSVMLFSRPGVRVSWWVRCTGLFNKPIKTSLCHVMLLCCRFLHMFVSLGCQRSTTADFDGNTVTNNKTKACMHMFVKSCDSLCVISNCHRLGSSSRTFTRRLLQVWCCFFLFLNLIETRMQLCQALK